MEGGDPDVPVILTGKYEKWVECGSNGSRKPEIAEVSSVNPMIAFLSNPSMKDRGREEESGPCVDALPVLW
jgi:hypothetical protein